MRDGEALGLWLAFGGLKLKNAAILLPVRVAKRGACGSRILAVRRVRIRDLRTWVVGEGWGADFGGAGRGFSPHRAVFFEKCGPFAACTNRLLAIES